MGNCLVTKLNGVVNNDNLAELGMAIVKFDTTGLSSNINVPFQSNIKRAYIVGNGTFADGTTEINDSQQVYFTLAPNVQVKVMVPKYPNWMLPYISSISATTPAPFTDFNFDDIQYGDEVTRVSANSIQATKRSAITGSINNITHAYGSQLQHIAVQETNVTGDINDAAWSKYAGLKQLNVSSTNVSGNVEVLVSNLVHGNAAASKARTDSLYLVIRNSAVKFRGQAVSYSILLEFTGTSTVNVYDAATGGTQIATYDIDTDVWTFNE